MVVGTAAEAGMSVTPPAAVATGVPLLRSSVVSAEATADLTSLLMEAGKGAL